MSTLQEEAELADSKQALHASHLVHQLQTLQAELDFQRTQRAQDDASHISKGERLRCELSTMSEKYNIIEAEFGEYKVQSEQKHQAQVRQLLAEHDAALAEMHKLNQQLHTVYPHTFTHSLSSIR